MGVELSEPVQKEKVAPQGIEQNSGPAKPNGETLDATRREQANLKFYNILERSREFLIGDGIKLSYRAPLLNKPQESSKDFRYHMIEFDPSMGATGFIGINVQAGLSAQNTERYLKHKDNPQALANEFASVIKETFPGQNREIQGEVKVIGSHTKDGITTIRFGFAVKGNDAGKPYNEENEVRLFINKDGKIAYGSSTLVTFGKSDNLREVRDFAFKDFGRPILDELKVEK